MILNRELLDEMETANYFGSGDDYAQNEIYNHRQRWTDAMARSGWPLDTEFDDDDDFTEACANALKVVLA